MSKGRRYRFNSLRISAIGLKFDEMMHSMMKEIVDRPLEFLWQAWARNMKLRKLHFVQKFGGMMQFTLQRIIVWNGHTQLIFAFPDIGRPRVLSFSERLDFLM